MTAALNVPGSCEEDLILVQTNQTEVTSSLSYATVGT